MSTTPKLKPNSLHAPATKCIMLEAIGPKFVIMYRTFHRFSDSPSTLCPSVPTNDLS